MTRLVRKTVILAKVETSVGVDAAPTGAANALKAFDMSITPLEMSAIAANVMAVYFGAAMSLPGSAFSKCSFSVLLSGAGLAATAPVWGALMLGCASAETTGLLTPNRVEYLPVTDALKTLTISWFDDGLLHTMLGAMGTVKLSAKSGQVPKLTFEFTGLETTPVPAANAVATLTAWKDPVAITKSNVTDIQLGCTYAAGALTGGTAYNSSGLELDWGNQVKFSPLLTTEAVVMDDRKIKGSMSLDLTAAQEADMIDKIKGRTLQSLGFVIGTSSGNQILLHAPAVVLKTHKKEEFNGQRMVGLDFELDPVAGNDELRIVSL